MYDFWIGTTCQNLASTAPTSPTGLMGASRQDPIQAARHLPGYGSGESVEDQLLVLIEDKDSDLSDPASKPIASVLGVFDRWFAEARAYAQSGQGLPVVLHQEPLPGEVWESPVLDGWVETARPMNGQAGNPTEERLSGSLALTLHVTRANYWEQPESQLYTSGAGGADGLNGTLISNQVVLDGRGSALVANLLKITPDATSGPQLPTPCRLEIETLTASGLGTLFVAQRMSSQAAGQSFMLEDTAASGGTPVSDDSACGGSYRVCTWEGTDETDLLTWALGRTLCQDGEGSFFRFLLRLGNDLVEENLQIKIQLKLHATQVVVGESAWSTLAGSRRLQELAALCLPPFKLRDAESAAALDLVLVGRSAATGSHSLGIDCLQMMPCDGWRRYDALYPCPLGWKLEDDGPRGTLSTLDAHATEQLTHVANGSPFLLSPAKVNSFYFAWMDAEGDCIKDDQVRVKAWCRNRRRIV